jgi:hypothetical protein
MVSVSSIDNMADSARRFSYFVVDAAPVAHKKSRCKWVLGDMGEPWKAAECQCWNKRHFDRVERFMPQFVVPRRRRTPDSLFNLLAIF